MFHSKKYILLNYAGKGPNPLSN
ncbi:hypothetical protein H312_02647, partial [Anncaliia algerae PRA339]